MDCFLGLVERKSHCRNFIGQCEGFGAFIASTSEMIYEMDNWQLYSLCRLKYDAITHFVYGYVYKGGVVKKYGDNFK